MILCAKPHEQGIDIFRIFDSLNSIENMRVSIDAVLETGAVCEPAICYTGDILDKGRPKYSLKYYVQMAKQLEKLGRAFSGHQGYGRTVQTLRRVHAGESAARGNRHSDSLSHA